jgi:hypothetical protein
MNNTKKKKRREGIFNYLMGGRIFTSDIFTKNAMLMGLIVVYSFLYVSNRYQHEQEIVKIYKLTKRKNEISNNLVIIKSEFAYRCRLSEIEKLLTEKGSDFQTLSVPPYIIDKNN